MADQLADLSSRGVSIWLDDLSRDRLTSGSLASLVARDHVAGVTTNPTIFAKAISGGGEAFVAFWLGGGRVLAGMNVNIWDVNDAIQDLVSGGRQVDPVRLADPGVPLDEAAG
jgi:hypothetical protein